MLESIRITSLFMEPFMPVSSQKVYEALGQGNVEELTDIKAASKWGQLKPGTKVELTDALFPRLKEDEVNFDID